MQSLFECFKMFYFILKESLLIYFVWMAISFVHGIRKKKKL